MQDGVGQDFEAGQAGRNWSQWNGGVVNGQPMLGTTPQAPRNSIELQPQSHGQTDAGEGAGWGNGGQTAVWSTNAQVRRLSL